MAKKLDALSKWNEIYDYNNAVCDGILLQFTKFIYHKHFKIPPISLLRELISEAMCHLTKSPFSLNIYSNAETNYKTVSSPLFDKISELIFEGENDCWLRDYLWRSEKFDSVWCYGSGDFFEYVDSKAAKGNVAKHLSKKEMEQINCLGKLMRKSLLQKMEKIDG
jgi:hypothetical protein